MATRSRAAPRRRSRRKSSTVDFRISPATARSLAGVVLLVIGAVTLIALLLPAGGLLNAYVNNLLVPVFGKGALLMPILLLLAGAVVERAPRVGSGWGTTILGGAVTFLGALGLIHLVSGRAGDGTGLREGGGVVGYGLSDTLTELVSAPGALVVLVGIILAGILLMFGLTLRSLVQPVASSGRAIAGTLRAPAGDQAPRREPGRASTAARGGRTTRDGGERGDREPRAIPIEPDPQSELPAPLPSPAPMSQTVWARDRERGAASELTGPQPTAATAVAVRPEEVTPDPLEAEDVPEPLHGRTWILPPLGVLDDTASTGQRADLDHERNRRIIVEKLRSFGIPAKVERENVGPVVTQYEVKPDVRVKLSRIEGLADDLAMALAARTIRIEAPIPGKDVVGIEIPNHQSEVVGFRELIEDSGMLEATSKLTFALGRDVSDKPFAVDLAKMPHLLVAGATGSGKSVCVNGLITSLLMRAQPTEVQLILVDLKRVELAAYKGLPHLLTDVIVEPADAKAALAWAVNEMEQRYRTLAEHTERNIAAFNASPRVAPEERLPYIVLVIDELADLMMREGRKVEEPIVKLAQKARAVGIHLVLATQRPSVNVVTGLIKANVPSRIAFAMASNVDSRTVLDAPGAEDLIGRGDMLYQPADLPRPVRLQGVFVSDAEVRAVAEHWREQWPEPQYRPEVTAFAGDGEGESGGQFGWLAKMAEDDMTPRAAELVTQTGKASTSMLQTKLKLGFNRASRVMDELERFGVVGPQDPRNPAVPRAVYGPENWLRSVEDVDAP